MDFGPGDTPGPFLLTASGCCPLDPPALLAMASRRRGVNLSFARLLASARRAGAMGNSSDEVKAQASAVTGSNENEGFAKAVRKFVLRPAGA